MIEGTELGRISTDLSYYYDDQAEACWNPWDNPDIDPTIPNIFPPVLLSDVEEIDPLAQDILDADLTTEEGQTAMLDILGLPEAEERLLAYLAAGPVCNEETEQLRAEALDAFSSIYSTLLDLETMYQDMPELAQRCELLRELIRERLIDQLGTDANPLLLEILDEFDSLENPAAPAPLEFEAETPRLSQPAAPFMIEQAQVPPETEAAVPHEPPPPPPPEPEPGAKEAEAEERLVAGIAEVNRQITALARDLEPESEVKAVFATEESAGIEEINRNIYNISLALLEAIQGNIDRSSREKQAGEIVERRS